MLEKFCTDCYYTVMYGDENENYTAEGVWAPLNEPEELDDFQCEGCGEYIVSGTSWLCERVY